MLGSASRFPLSDGYHDLPPGKLANVATSLEMRAKPALRPVPPMPGLRIEREREIEVERYLALFRRVGAEFLWFSRLQQERETLAASLHDPRVELWIVGRDGVAEDLGIVELDFRTAGECELLFFGFASGLRGTPAARTLMNFAIERAWSHPIERFWVHTCSLDDPKALPFYRRTGFVPYKRQLEIHDDPRIVGLLPRDAAPAIPLIDSSTVNEHV